MSETIIYLSVMRGEDALTLDGDLYLFAELLTTINDAARQLAPADLSRAATLTSDDVKPSKGGTLCRGLRP
jgi:hypothetical protein